MKNIKRLLGIFPPYLGYIIPFFCLILSFFSFFHVNKKHLTTYFLFIIIIIIIEDFIQKKKSILIYRFITSLFFGFCSFVFISNWILFNTDITESSIYIILETNLNESIEFFSSYINSIIYIIGFSCFLSVFLGLYFTNKNFINNRKITIISKKFRILLIGFFIVCIFLLKSYFLPYVTVTSIYNYHKNRKIISSIDIKSKGKFKNVTHKESKENEIYVILIGESTTRHHMSLYGYERKTNPLLEKRNDLIVYNDVITPISNTIWSLRKALTLNRENYNRYNYSLVQLFNSVGFNTYWISNQKPIGIYETSTKFISKTSDKSIFLNSTESLLDEKLIKPFKKVLREEKKKKFIVLHLMGTHALYKSRYPKEFDFFKETPKTKFKHKKAYEKINEYDNAVLYNDYIVNCLIDELKQTNSKSYLLYFSDHGEDVYETLNNAVHSLEIGSKPMHDVPFILWRSDKFLSESKTFIWNKNRKFSIENLIYTASDLSQISFKGFKPEKSIVNYHFKKEKRIIKNNEVYETVFNQK